VELLEDAAQLVVKINNNAPIEVSDFARSMLSLGNEYQRFLGTGEYAATPDDVKLFVRDVRSGSITATLAAFAPAAIPFIEHADSIVEFAKHLKTMYEWLRGEGSGKPAKLDKTTLQNLNYIVEPVAKDAASQLNISAINIQGGLVVNLPITSLDANAIQNHIRRELDALAEPVTGLHEQVVMYWAQARGAGKVGDKARIESLYKGDVKVRFTDDQLKSSMLHKQPYPFGTAFVVDVVVETVRERPVLYKVMRLHEVIPLEQ
jgi:hypothetical protein